MNINLNLDSFRAMVGKDNYGDVRLNGNGGLEKVNNHFFQHQFGLGSQKIDPEECRYIRESFLKAISSSGVSGDVLDKIRGKLGIGNQETIELALSRRTIAEVLKMVDESKFGVKINRNPSNTESLNSYKDTAANRIIAHFDSELNLSDGKGNTVVNVSRMSKAVSDWNAGAGRTQINLSDDQLGVLFNRYGTELKRNVLDELLPQGDLTRDGMDSICSEKNLKAKFSTILAKSIQKVMTAHAQDSFARGETGLGVQGGARTSQVRNAVRQAVAGKESKFKVASTTLWVTENALAKYKEHYSDERAALSDEVVFTPEDFKVEPFKGATETVLANTAKELNRVHLEVVIQGDENSVVNFEYRNENASEAESKNLNTLNGLLSKLKDAKGSEIGKEQTQGLLKAMGQKFSSSVLGGVGWTGSKKAMKLDLKFENDGSIMATLIYDKVDSVLLDGKDGAGKDLNLLDTVDEKEWKKMEFDFRINADGSNHRMYLGQKENVEKAKAAAGVHMA